MNISAIPISVPDGGFAPVDVVQSESYDRQTTRRFYGSNTNFIALPGCLRVDQVRVGPLLLEAKILHEVPLDLTLQRLVTLEYDGYRLIHGVDGTPLLQRSRYSNFGIFQKDLEIFVTGEWDVEISPVPEPEAPPDIVTHAMATAAPRGPGRPRKE